MSEDDKDEDIDRLRKAAAILGEHFETVQIFTTRVMDEGESRGNTISCHHGIGNWHAREGQCREWVIENDERVREHIRKEE